MLRLAHTFTFTRNRVRCASLRREKTGEPVLERLSNYSIGSRGLRLRLTYELRGGDERVDRLRAYFVFPPAFVWHAGAIYKVALEPQIPLGLAVFARLTVRAI